MRISVQKLDAEHSSKCFQPCQVEEEVTTQSTSLGCINLRLRVWLALRPLCLRLRVLDAFMWSSRRARPWPERVRLRLPPARGSNRRVARRAQQRRQRCPRRRVLKVVVVVVVVDRVPLESAQHELKGPRIVSINLCIGSSTRRQVFARRLLLNLSAKKPICLIDTY